METGTHVVDEAILGRLKLLREHVSRQGVYSVIDDPDVEIGTVGECGDGEWALLCGQDQGIEDVLDYSEGLLIVVSPNIGCARGWLHTIGLPADLLTRLVEWLYEMVIVEGV